MKNLKGNLKPVSHDYDRNAKFILEYLSVDLFNVGKKHLKYSGLVCRKKNMSVFHNDWV